MFYVVVVVVTVADVVVAQSFRSSCLISRKLRKWKTVVVGGGGVVVVVVVVGNAKWKFLLLLFLEFVLLGLGLVVDVNGSCSSLCFILLEIIAAPAAALAAPAAITTQCLTL